MAKNNYRVFYTDCHTLRYTDVYAKNKRAAEKKARPAIDQDARRGQIHLDICRKVSVNAVSASRLPGVWWNEYCDRNRRVMDLYFINKKFNARWSNAEISQFAGMDWKDLPVSVKNCLKQWHVDYRIVDLRRNVSMGWDV